MIRKILILICALAIGLGAVTAVQAKLNNKDWNKAKKELEKVLTRSNVPSEDIVKAIKRVAEDNSDRAVKLLLTLGLRIEVTSIYEATKMALASITDPKGMKFIRKELESRSDRKWTMKVMLVEVVARMPGREKINILTKLAQKGQRQEVLFAVIRAFRIIDDKPSIGPLIDLVALSEGRKGRVWMDARQALYDITGEDFDDSRDWKSWWEGAKAGWEKSENDEGENEGDKSESKGYTTSTPKKTKLPRFFGTEVASKLIVFVLDTSGSMIKKDPKESTEEEKKEKKRDGRKTSMADPSKKKKKGAKGGSSDPKKKLPEDRMRIRRAQKELIECIKGLAPDVWFNIVTYDIETTTWSDTGLKAASGANKKDAIKYVDNFTPRGTTHMDDAIERAFKENKKANTIYLLTDGWPTHTGDNSDSKKIIKKIWKFLEKANKFRKVRIFTFGFINAHRGFMLELAEKNGGVYKDIK